MTLSDALGSFQLENRGVLIKQIKEALIEEETLEMEEDKEEEETLESSWRSWCVRRTVMCV